MAVFEKDAWTGICPQSIADRWVDAQGAERLRRMALFTHADLSATNLTYKPTRHVTDKIFVGHVSGRILG